MATFYVDYEGEAGSGDGSSFANRAKRCNVLSGVAAGDTIRIKKSPDPTVLSSTGSVKRDWGWMNYSAASFQKSNITYSTTTGGTYLTNLSAGWQTGDIIVIGYDTAPAGKNLNGAWRITRANTTSGNTYLDGFTASNTDSESGTIRYVSATANSVVLGSSPIKVIASTDAARSAWTASSNVTTSVAYHSSYSDWNQYGKWQVPTGSDEIALTTSASTGKAAYFALGSSMDLSSYQQISFIFQCASGNTNLGVESSGGMQISLRLCTDTQGDTSVHTIPINNGRSSTNRWITIKKDLATNLNSGIQSVAIYIDATLASDVTIRLNNIVASKASSAADSVNLSSLIGLNTTADKIWYPIAYMVERSNYFLIVLCTWPRTRGADGMSYYGNYIGAWFSQNFSSTNIYKREQIFPKIIKEGAFSGNSFNDHLSVNGSSGNLVSYSGGWDDTNMSSQNGLTFLQGSGMGKMFYSNSSYKHYEKLFTHSFYKGFELQSSYTSVDDCGTSCDYDYPQFSGGEHIKFKWRYSFGGYNWGMYYQGHRDAQGVNSDPTDFEIGYVASGMVNTRPMYWYGVRNIHWNLINTESTTNDGFFIDSQCKNLTFETIKSGWCIGGYAFRIYDSSNTSQNITVKNLYVFSGANGVEIYSNGTGFKFNNYINTNPSGNGPEGGTNNWRYGQYISANYCLHIKNNSNIEVLDGSISRRVYALNTATAKLTGVILQNTNGGYSSIKTDPVSISSSYDAKCLFKNYDDTNGDNRNFFGKGRITPETSIRHTASGFSWKFNYNPNYLADRLSFELGKVLVNSGSLVTISVWVYKSNSTAVGTLEIPANSDLGLSSDVITDTSSVSATTWTKISATFTPTGVGAATVKIGAYNTGSTEAVYFDDLEVTQA